MPGPHGGVLSAPGLCAYCDAPTLASCRLCGRAICGRHESPGGQTCLDCVGRPAD